MTHWTAWGLDLLTSFQLLRPPLHLCLRPGPCSALYARHWVGPVSQEFREVPGGNGSSWNNTWRIDGGILMREVPRSECGLAKSKPSSSDGVAEADLALERSERLTFEFRVAAFRAINMSRYKGA